MPAKLRHYIFVIRHVTGTSEKKTVKCPVTSVCTNWRYSKRKSSVRFRVIGVII